MIKKNKSMEKNTCKLFKKTQRDSLGDGISNEWNSKVW